MDRIIEERQVGGHQVVIVEEVMDEGTGYVLVVDEVLVTENEPLDRIPTDAEVREILHAHGYS